MPINGHAGGAMHGHQFPGGDVAPPLANLDWPCRPDHYELH